MQDLRTRNQNLDGNYAVRGQYRLACSTGLVTTIAAATATAGHLFCMRWPDATAKFYLRYLGARFLCTTAYTTAQETGVDWISARSYTVNDTGGTAIDVGSTVAHTGNYQTSQNVSLITAGCVRVATAAALTAGTHTLDANAMGVLSDYSSGIGTTVPTTSSGSQSQYGALFDARYNGDTPVEYSQNEGFKIRNLTLMGAVGVGRWDFLMIWDEGIPNRT